MDNFSKIKGVIAPKKTGHRIVTSATGDSDQLSFWDEKKKNMKLTQCPRGRECAGDLLNPE